MDAALTKQLTRREKRIDTRNAVDSAIRTLGRRLASKSWDDLINKILDEIKRTRATPYPIDQKDVSLALRWLCSREIISISHVDPQTGARSHLIEKLGA